MTVNMDAWIGLFWPMATQNPFKVERQSDAACILRGHTPVLDEEPVKDTTSSMSTSTKAATPETAGHFAAKSHYLSPGIVLFL